MKIIQFSLSRYRSIIEAEKIDISDYTILIGKNNEGKSNILRAISVAIDSIRHFSVYGEDRSFRSRRVYPNSRRGLDLRFEWASDFPIPLQGAKSSNKKTRFRIDFELDDKEVDDFHGRFGLALNSRIPVVIEISQTSEVNVSIAKPGKGSVSFGKKVKEICAFIVERIDFVYVPAVRTDRDATGIVADLLRSSLAEVEKNEDYQKAVDQIQQAQKPMLDKLAVDISQTLRKFIPTIKSVSIDSSAARIYGSLSRDIDLVIDDGVATQLSAKGDGIKSLVALSLFQSSPAIGKSRILAIEEPESHLHHGAVHELKNVLRDLSTDGQVIISSHNPVFVDRDNLYNVVLVDGGRAEKVKSIDKLRSSLGVLVSDNLVNSEFSIVCEGGFDARSLKSLFSSISPRLKTLIANGNIVFEELGGSAKLSYKIQTLNRDVFKYYVIMDYDDAGKNAVDAALKYDVLRDKDYSLLKIRGNFEAEIEDALLTDAIRPLILDVYGIDISTAPFGGNKKWSDRMRSGFEASGKIWTADLESSLKELAASLFDEKPLEKMRQPAVDLFMTIVGILERKCG